MSYDKEKIQKLVLSGMLKSLLTSLPMLIAAGMVFLPKHSSRVTFALAAFIPSWVQYPAALRRIQKKEEYLVLAERYPVRLRRGLFIAGFSGVIIAIRKEAPGSLVSIRGVPAVIIGIIGTLLFWSSAIIILLFE